jgi:hypothetical protein
MGSTGDQRGTPVRAAPYPRWPQWIRPEREQLLEALEVRQVVGHRRLESTDIRSGVGAIRPDAPLCGRY